MISLYTSEYALNQRKAYQKWRYRCLATAVCALGISILLCFFVTTKNATALFCAVSGVSIAAGWIYMLFLSPKKRACKAEYVHCENILGKTDTEVHKGLLHVSGDVIQVPGSIKVRTVKLENDEAPALYHLNANFSLPENGTYVILRCAGNYVKGYEVPSDA